MHVCSGVRSVWQRLKSSPATTAAEASRVAVDELLVNAPTDTATSRRAQVSYESGHGYSSLPWYNVFLSSRSATATGLACSSSSSQKSVSWRVPSALRPPHKTVVAVKCTMGDWKRETEKRGKRHVWKQRRRKQTRIGMASLSFPLCSSSLLLLSFLLPFLFSPSPPLSFYSPPPFFPVPSFLPFPPPSSPSPAPLPFP